jgi:hypothetical protein
MEIQMKGSDEWVCFGPGDAYNVPPGHLPRFTKGETVMMEFSSDPTYTNANFISGLNFFVIQHTFKAGKAEEWWGKFKDVMADPQGMENMAKAAHDAGFHNHAFLPMPDASGTVHCVWEAQPGKGVKDMQAFIDGPAGPSMGCMDNIVFGPVDAATAQLAYTPFFGNSNASAPPAEVKGSTMYMVCALCTCTLCTDIVHVYMEHVYRHTRTTKPPTTQTTHRSSTTSKRARAPPCGRTWASSWLTLRRWRA